MAILHCSQRSTIFRLVQSPSTSYALRSTPPLRNILSRLRNPFVRALTTIPTCPSPTCACQELPADLDIDRKLPLSNTMPVYHQHIVIPTGRTDWTSRIEDDEGLGIIKELKDMLGPKGEFANVSRHFLV